MTDGLLPLEIIEVPQLAGTPFYGFAIQAHAMLIAEGSCDPSKALMRDMDSAIIARVSGEVVGIAVFRKTLHTHLSLRLAYVLPDYRRRGVFRQMFEMLVKIAEHEGRSRIVASAAIGNVVFNKVAVACGLSVTDQIYTIDMAL